MSTGNKLGESENNWERKEMDTTEIPGRNRIPSSEEPGNNTPEQL